ncbi:MAG: PorP/SprF family type IX secretion system membrane protein [Bacteroidales bacterium]|nr:PorP/SprF family type IX secretion system membrane protein [Bacteroidales bacterium]NLK81464.1 PorP/SprF family type IX secretion system membrane protein [Bacteroidales bacterium]
MKQLFFAILILFATGISAQQTQLYSLYMLHDFACNPAVAGTDDFLKTQINKRYQFLGIQDAPSTTSYSVHGNLENLSMGWGGMIYKDTHGAFSKFGAYAAYAYRIALDARTNISFGLNLGLINYKVDATSLTALQEEVNFDFAKYSYIRPDATAGIYIKSKDYFGGIAVDQLFNNKIELIEDANAAKNTISRLKSHYSIMAGYIYKLSYGFTFEPTVVIRKAALTPLQVEASARAVYNKTAWAGIGIRTSDAVTLLIGYNYQKTMYFAYAYDITYSNLRKDSFGSHEIILGIRFPEPFLNL